MQQISGTKHTAESPGDRTFREEPREKGQTAAKRADKAYRGDPRGTWLCRGECGGPDIPQSRVEWGILRRARLTGISHKVRRIGHTAESLGQRIHTAESPAHRQYRVMPRKTRHTAKGRADLTYHGEPRANGHTANGTADQTRRVLGDGAYRVGPDGPGIPRRALGTGYNAKDAANRALP